MGTKRGFKKKTFVAKRLSNYKYRIRTLKSLYSQLQVNVYRWIFHRNRMKMKSLIYISKLFDIIKICDMKLFSKLENNKIFCFYKLCWIWDVIFIPLLQKVIVCESCPVVFWPNSQGMQNLLSVRTTNLVLNRFKIDLEI